MMELPLCYGARRAPRLRMRGVNAQAHTLLCLLVKGP